MYKLFIVDDEPDVVEGLYNAFTTMRIWNWTFSRPFQLMKPQILNTERA